MSQNPLMNLMPPTGAQAGFQNALSMGLQMGRQMADALERKQYRSALGVLATDPDNADAMSTVFQHNPEVGARLMDRADNAAFGRDVANMMAPGGQPNALLGLTGGMQMPAPSMATPVAGASIEPTQTVSAEPEKSFDLSVLGVPQSQADEAFLRLVQRDPIKALKIRSALRDNFVAQAEAEADFYGLAMGELSRATDQASWDAGLQAVLPRAQALNADLMSVVPSQYPGADGVAALMAKAQPIKDQLDLMLREANIDADNARSDRNTDSLIATRGRRAAEYERRGRAGEDIRRRGQDMADRRTAMRGGDRASSGQGGNSLPVVSSPAEAARLPKGTRFRTPDGRVKMVP